MKKLIVLLCLLPVMAIAAGPYIITGVVHTTQIAIACDRMYASSNSITAWLPCQLRDFTIATDPERTDQIIYVGWVTNTIRDVHTETTNGVSWAVTNTFLPTTWKIKDGTLSMSIELGSPTRMIYLTGGATNTGYSIIGKESM